MGLLKVLVVDDDEESRKHAEIAIECYANHNKINYEVYEASTSEEGFKILQEKNPIDVIVLNVFLKVKDNAGNGYDQYGIDDFLKPLRNKGYKGKIICWSNDEKYRWASRKAGADEFLDKGRSYQLEDVLNVLFK